MQNEIGTRNLTVANDDPGNETAGVLNRAFLAPEGLEAQVEHELSGTTFERYGRLFVGVDAPVAFAQNVWLAPREVEINSIGHAVKTLRAIQRNWALYDFQHHRRAKLIVEQLPKVSGKPFQFGNPAPLAPMGAFTLLAPNRLLLSAACSSPFPNGDVHFIEDKTGPPSRAYLKLWEALTILGVKPRPGETCLDLGSSPGGWTWVLAELGARVISVDKAPLEPSISARPNVEFRSGSAFALTPGDLPPIDWLFSDVICYPKRLCAMIERWIAAPKVPNIVCTVKFQGETDFESVDRLRAIPGGRLVHLYNNKHELTFFRIAS